MVARSAFQGRREVKRPSRENANQAATRPFFTRQASERRENAWVNSVSWGRGGGEGEESKGVTFKARLNSRGKRKESAEARFLR